MRSQDAATVGGRCASTAGGSESHADRRLLIDGRLVTADRVFPSVNPASGEVVGHAPDAGVAETQAAIAAARRAFDTTSWPTDVQLRIRCLDQLHQALLDHADGLRELTIAEVGATRALTHGAQLGEPVGIVRYYPDLLRTYPMTEELGQIESRGMRHRRWVEKEAAGVVNVLSSSDPAAGAVLTTSPDVDVITFTGSTATGRQIMAAASETVKRVFLELAQNFAKVRHGDPADPKTYMGPLINERQRDKVDGMVRRAVAAGATLVTGGKRLIRAGSFSINGGNYFAADCPFGGFKQSGVGREMGVAGLEEFLQRKTLAVPVVPVSGVA